MIFKFISIAFKGNQFRKNPSEFLQEEAKGFVNGLVFMPMVVPGLFVLLFFLLGYTGLLTGPYGFFKFLFWIAFIPFVIIFWLLLKATRIIKRASKSAIHETIKVKAEVKN